MNDRFSNRTDAAESKGGLLAWLILCLSVFPLIALLTYDWHAIAAFCCPPQPTTNWIGALGDGFARYGYALFGLAIWLVPFACIFASAIRIVQKGRHELARFVWFTSFLIAAACLCQSLGAHLPVVTRLCASANLYSPGGAVGFLVMSRCLSPLLSDFGASVLMLILMTVSLVATIGASNLLSALRAILRWALPDRAAENDDADAATDDADDPSGNLSRLREAKEAVRRAREEEKNAAREAKQRAKDEKLRLKEEKRLAKEAAKEAARKAHEEELNARLGLGQNPVAPTHPLRTVMTPLPAPTGATRAAKAPPAPEEDATSPDKGPYILPPVSLLNPPSKTMADHGDVNTTSKKLVDTLKLFGIDASLAYTVQGPVVTKYALMLEPGTKYSSVTSISDNLMGALHAKSLRIEAPIPGEECVGIEVPNRTSAGISFREIVESEAWRSFRGELPLLFGKDAAGRELIADLAKMPHMLVAGATGQGKSVCLNAIINGLLMTKKPSELKLIMVDPKSVEFTSYVSIPHLIVPIITDNRKVVFSLHWAVAEMEKRLKMFALARVRNIYDFNHRKRISQPDMFGTETPIGADLPASVPYIVIIIDEVADLMAAESKNVTPDISRLTAKARAAGIHLILATQRPDAKIITGTIKANIPGRVAFKTATSIDSRTILDDTGAENLIGKGDMLFRTADGQLIRAQGAWISDPEIERITEFIGQHSNTEFDETFKSKLARVKEAGISDPFADNPDDPDNQGNEGGGGDSDEPSREQVKAEESASDFKKAVECIINTNRASISHFQRRLGWGYNHSAKIMDMLEDAGVIGPQAGAGPRPITMDQQQLMAIFNSSGTGAAEDAPATAVDGADDLNNELTDMNPEEEESA